MKTVKYKDKTYPHFQSEGNAAQFAIPFAKHFCFGHGADVGCSNKDWAFPGAIPVDLEFEDEWHADNLPRELDYIFSSHCLEHVSDWVATMDYWYGCLNDGGVLFLYLPHYEQEYWRPWNNRKHKHTFTPNVVHDYMLDKGYENIFCSERDLNHSFMIVGEK